MEEGILFQTLAPANLEDCLKHSTLCIGITTLRESAFLVLIPCLSKYISTSLHSRLGASP